jgi:hypothetical protein
MVVFQYSWANSMQLATKEGEKGNLLNPHTACCENHLFFVEMELSTKSKLT